MRGSAGPPKRTGRGDLELRAISFECGAAPYAEGSCLVSFGDTRVLCTASVEEGVPAWREAAAGPDGSPRSTECSPAPPTADGRGSGGGAGGRTREIERLIGRSLRAVTDLQLLGRRTVVVDCDVIQADGGTRTASITGGCVALGLALRDLERTGLVEQSPRLDLVAAVSVGLLASRPILDLDYGEDRRAQVDMNVVATGRGTLVEVQGTAEGEPFGREELDRMLDIALDAIADLTVQQRDLMLRE